MNWDGGMMAQVDLDTAAREYLNQASEVIIRCRLFGHAWDPTHDGYIVDGRGRERVYTQTVRCLRCTTEGVDRFDPVTLDRINTRSYAYADGYLMRDHKGGLSRREVRQWIAAKATGGRRLRRVS